MAICYLRGISRVESLLGRDGVTSGVRHRRICLILNFTQPCLGIVRDQFVRYVLTKPRVKDVVIEARRMWQTMSVGDYPLWA